MSGGEKVHGPNGYGDYIVSCYDISRCYSKAAYECDGAYDVVHVTDGISDGGTVVHNMLISCESPSIYQKDTYWSR